jgi:hypothetical protein
MTTHRPVRWTRLETGLRALLAGVAVSSCGFADPITGDPNSVGDPTLDHVLAAVIGTARDIAAGGRFGPFWIQQLDGAVGNRLGQYEFLEGDDGTLMVDVYGGGGLANLRFGERLAEQGGHRAYEGAFKVLEAFLVGNVASLYGDVPYSEAANPEVDTPALDSQRDVYAQLHALLEEAVLDLASGEGRPLSQADLLYDGDVDGWIGFAHTLAARYHLHWAEVDGDSRYQAALAEAADGISDISREWIVSRDPPREQNAWYYTAASTSAGEFLVDALVARSDPRLPLYFGEATGPYAGQYVGSHPDDPGDPGTDASRIACVAGYETDGFCALGTGYGSLDFDLPGITCAENYFIMAEAEHRIGTEAGAHAALDAALECEEQRKGVDLSATRTMASGLSDEALFEEIMMQKYIALFLSNEVWNDYKRTCRPAVNPYAGGQIPGRLLYPTESRTGNPNVPSVEEQIQSDPFGRPLGANANDPFPCPS